jgi:hypothetical protein
MRMLILLAFLLPSSVYGQNNAASTTLDFCGKHFPLSKGYTASANSLYCPDGTYLLWENPASVTAAAARYHALETDVRSQSKECLKQPVNLFLASSKTEGYKLLCETKEGLKNNRMITYGVVNGRPVVLQVFYKNEMNENRDLPGSVRQIVRF